jgi:hypothetical protein
MKYLAPSTWTAVALALSVATFVATPSVAFADCTVQQLAHRDPTQQGNPSQELAHRDPTQQGNPSQELAHRDPTQQGNPSQELTSNVVACN